MKIEVNIDGEGQKVHSLTKSIILIGASVEADLIIKAKGTSRKHLQLEIENDQFYITDLGSTNGTYLFDQQLIPGKRTQWPTFIPIRLGDNVLINFLTDESTEQSEMDQPATGSNEPTNDRTQVINLNELKKAKTEDLIKRKKIKPQVLPQKKKETPWFLYPLGLFILLAAIHFAPQGEETITQAPPARTNIPLRQVKAKVVPPVPEDELKPKKLLQNAIKDIKCTSELEKYLCGKILNVDKKNYGVVQTGNTLMILVDASDLIDEAKAMLKEYEYEVADNDVDRLTAMLYLKRSIPDDLDTQKLLDKNLSIGFFKSREVLTPTLKFAMALKAQTLKDLKPLLLDGHFNNVRKVGASAFTFSKRYVVIY